VGSTPTLSASLFLESFRGVAQLAEHSSPKREVGGSSPLAPAKTPEQSMFRRFSFDQHSIYFRPYSDSSSTKSVTSTFNTRAIFTSTSEVTLRYGSCQIPLIVLLFTSAARCSFACVHPCCSAIFLSFSRCFIGVKLAIGLSIPFALCACRCLLAYAYMMK
jgi:hypothetical protein